MPPQHDGVGLARAFSREADYTRPPLDVPPEARERLEGLLAEDYGAGAVPELTDEVLRILRVHHAHRRPEAPGGPAAPGASERFNEKDVILITYADLIVADDEVPLQTLRRVAEEYFDGLVTTIHLLPFFPWSSDRGFSVMSYWHVDRSLGSWSDIAALNDSFRLMFDGVFNHASKESRWFHDFRAAEPNRADFFLSFTSPNAIGPEDMGRILRPRTSPLLTRTETVDGPRWVWTTFSEDQADLNYRNPAVLLEILDLLLYYVRRGADLIRLDAVTYLWKELGTSCAHLPQTHALIRLLRTVLDVVEPHVALITETNVPHPDNTSYFGSGDDEAQMVYNFALPPLVLHTFLSGDATTLTRWARDLEPPSPTTHFLNFLSSHDGIGLMGARGILSEEEIEEMCRRAVEHGGLVSMRSNRHGGESPYELNVTWFSALNRIGNGEDPELQVDRFMASRAVALVLKGVPGVYFPALIGSRNDLDAVARTASKRDINRTAIHERILRRLLARRSSATRRVSDRFLALLDVRRAEPAFHPCSAQETLDAGPEVFAVLRRPDAGPPVLCLISVVDRPVEVHVDAGETFGPRALDLVSRRSFDVPDGMASLRLEPYEVLWLRSE